MGRLLHAAVLLGGILAAGAVRADGITGSIEEDVTSTHGDNSDPGGGRQRFETVQLIQRYRLGLERSLFPMLRLNAGGSFEQINAETTTLGVSNDYLNRTTSFFGNLTLATDFLGATAGYSRRQFLATGSPWFVNEEPAFTVGWRPLGLPSFSLRLSRPSTYDATRTIEDLTTTQALFSAQYLPSRELDLRYALEYGRPQDHLHGTDTTSVTQYGSANYGATLEPWRTSVAAGLNATVRRTMVNASGQGGEILTPVLPVTGLSAIETFPATPELVTLVPNAALIDGVTTLSTGLNIGFGPRLSGDQSNRDIGVQFADAVTSVNVFYVWVDRSLPAEASAALTWTAWKSDDNLHWTQVALSGLPVFPLFVNRFEIRIQTTAARYLKVVTQPLVPGATVDPQLANILVTEIQCLFSSPITRSSGWQRSNSELFTASLRTQILGRPDLSYDFSLSSSRAEQEPTAPIFTYILANGLSYNRKLDPIVLLAARVMRQDVDQSHGHESAWLYSASLSVDELATLGHTLGYSGQTTFALGGMFVQNSLSLFNRATPYRGLSLLAGFSYGTITDPVGRTSRTNSVTLNATVQPHRSLLLGGTWGRSGTVALGGALATAISTAQRIEGTFSFTPFPALYASGTISRSVNNGLSYTLAQLAAGLSPFQGGALQFNFSVNEVLDSTGSVTRYITPSIRWNINRSAVLTASYTWSDATGGPIETRARTFNLNLRIPL